MVVLDYGTSSFGASGSEVMGRACKIDLSFFFRQSISADIRSPYLERLRFFAEDFMTVADEHLLRYGEHRFFDTRPLCTNHHSIFIGNGIRHSPFPFSHTIYLRYTIQKQPFSRPDRTES